MNDSDAREKLIELWLEKADDALASAELELKAGHTNFAVNRLFMPVSMWLRHFCCGMGSNLRGIRRSNPSLSELMSNPGWLMPNGTPSIRNYSMIDRKGIISLRLLLNNRTFQQTFSRPVSS